MDRSAEQERGREELVSVVRDQAGSTECWQHAEHVVRADLLRRRLHEVGVELTPDVAVALMAGAMFLAGASPEFGGDYRDALGDLAALGRELLEG